MTVFGAITRADWEAYYNRPGPGWDPMADWPCGRCKRHPGSVGCGRPLDPDSKARCQAYIDWAGRQWRIVTGREAVWQAVEKKSRPGGNDTEGGKGKL